MAWYNFITLDSITYNYGYARGTNAYKSNVSSNYVPSDSSSTWAYDRIIIISFVRMRMQQVSILRLLPKRAYLIDVRLKDFFPNVQIFSPKLREEVEIVLWDVEK